MSQTVARSRSAAAAGSGSAAIPREAATRPEAGPAANAAPSSSRLPTLGADAGDEEDRAWHQLPHAGDVNRLGGADDGAHAAQPALPEQTLGEPVDEPGKALVQGLPRGRQVLDVGGTGVAGPNQGEDSGAGLGGGGDQGLERVEPEQRVGGEGVGAEAGDRAPGCRRLTDQGLRVGGGGDRDVAALAVGDNQQAGLASGGADRGEGRPAGGAEALEAGELRLDRDAGRAGALDQAATVGDDRGARQLGGGAGVARLRPLPGEFGRVGVEAETDLAATLRDERREPIRECCGNQPPLTLVLSAEPAEKRGTLPPGIVIRSPVRGFTP